MADKKNSNKEIDKMNNHQNYDDDKKPNFEDPESFVDDVDDEELLADILAQKPTMDNLFDGVIIVDGVPKVEPKRLEKLQSVIEKIFGKFGQIVHKAYPQDEDGTTKGYVFFEYDDPASALNAVQHANNYKMDKNHTLLVNLYTDIKKYENLSEDWEPPKPRPFKLPKDLFSWLLDPECYDEFCTVTGNPTTVQIWKNSLPEPILLEDRRRWTETYVKWSPQGSYLATIHPKGVALWGGSKFEQIGRFMQDSVECIDFSPGEQYIVTFAPRTEDKKLALWDILTGEEKRSFFLEGPNVWPLFKWSHDDKYVAYMGEDILSVYETPSFGLLGKKSIKMPGIKDFSWSPTSNVIAFWVPEDKDVPARVSLIEIPSRNEIRKNNLFNVADCKIFWQKSGDYLCVKVDRFGKKKEKTEQKWTESCKYQPGQHFQGMTYNFEIFHMREKLIPVDSVEIKEPIHAFAWEPVGSKFVIIHGEVPTVNVSFYEVRCGVGPALLKKMDKKACNRIFWSPSGQFCVLAGLDTMSGALEFIDTNEFTSMNLTDHYQASDVEWDPTGRYVVTSVLSCKTTVDNGYWMWSFQGRILKRINLNQFTQFMWRPRPPSVLSKEKIKEIKKNIKKYSAKFESEDRLRLTRASKEQKEKRRGLMKEFEEYRSKRIAQYNEQKPRRLELRKNIDTDDINSDTTNLEEEVVEFFIKEETIVLD